MTENAGTDEFVPNPFWNLQVAKVLDGLLDGGAVAVARDDLNALK